METNRDEGAGEKRYFIDPNWYHEHERSFAVLISSRLCPASQKKKVAKSENALLKTISQCCSKWEGFITADMPILEVVFRILLANGNQPLSLDEIRDRLQQILTDTTGPRELSIERLERILARDDYYGIRAAPAPRVEEPSTVP
ncbi:MAG: hypothetical protein IBX68_01285 [Dehalococcoidia bacterium]|nr:hypothetical protein [Dehalococcoidia bacterium]